MVSQLTQNFPSISKSMLHSMEGTFYVWFLEAHKISPPYGGKILCGLTTYTKFPLHKSMLHSMEGKFYVGSLEVHKPNPNSNPNHVPYWEVMGGGGGGGGGDIKFPLRGWSKMSFCVAISDERRNFMYLLFFFYPINPWVD